MRQPKVRLRAIEPEDLDLLYQIENDRRLWNVGTTNVPYSRYTLHDYVATAADDIYTDRQVRLIIENEQGETVGMADLMNFCPQHVRAELGIVVLDAKRRQGYASAAVKEVIEYAANILHLHQVYVVIAHDNQPALQLFTKNSFEGHCVLHDWLFDGHQYADAVVLQRIL